MVGGLAIWLMPWVPSVIVFGVEEEVRHDLAEPEGHDRQVVAAQAASVGAPRMTPKMAASTRKRPSPARRSAGTRAPSLVWTKQLLGEVRNAIV